MAEHEWIEVGNRRWCVGCSLFQWKSQEGVPWQPRSRGLQPCPRDTPYAVRNTRKALTEPDVEESPRTI